MHPTAVMAVEGPESSAIHPRVEPRALAARSGRSFIVVVAVSAIAACSPANEVGDATLRMADADTANELLFQFQGFRKAQMAWMRRRPQGIDDPHIKA